ncbi:Ig-like domain-containing protein [Cochlodiniinecator piscidefendens]|uniref:Ig-like domain-containing protein n=1 Tax=Cochlodiniinecator piscidefendens TaxID=2715756 RepID=UPI0014092050|nr:Ig-like domain-containing protein [Cochlodiniinecator piscidefendens]
MITVDYTIRDNAGVSYSGASTGAEQTSIFTAVSKDVSLNLSPSDVSGYERAGQDLRVVLLSGEVIILENFYSEGVTGDKSLFLSENGELIEVTLVEDGNGGLFAQYNTHDIAGKWSEYDDLVFLDIERIEPVVAPLVAPLLGGFGGVGIAGAAGAAVVGGALIGGGGDSVAVPTVNGGDLVIGGTSTETPTVSGTGEPGHSVAVTVGGVTETVVIDDSGNWKVTFDPFPEDGVYTAEVVVTTPEGETTTLVGPSLDFDTTAPEVVVETGTGSVGDNINAVGHASGATISGTGEVGSTVVVEIQGTSHSVVVGEGGSWSVNFETSEITTGEYTSDVTITTTDVRGNSRTVTDTLVVDTVAPVAEISTIEGDNTINGSELSDGIVIEGTGEAGARAVIELNGETREVVISENGTWSVSFEATTLAGGTYDTTVSVTTFDAVGNSSSVSQVVHVDTEGNVSLGGNIEGDNIVNAAEQSDGVVLNGVAEAGSSVVVTLQGVSHTVIADADGNWTANFTASEVPAGTYDATITAVATDAAGNVTTAEGSVRIDTEATVSVNSNIEIDNVINAVEQSDGVTLTGLAEAGSSVVVTLQGVSHTVTADSDGNWSANFTATEIPAGTYDAAITAVATDLAGNTSTANGSVHVDTETSVSIGTNHAGGDSIINAAESATDIVLNGVAEAGASVEVSIGSVTRTAVVDANGNWTATFAAGSLPGGEYDTTVVAVATDAAGNSSTATTAIRVDTVVGEVALSTLPIEIDDTINAVESADGVMINGTATPGLTVTVQLGTVTHTALADANGNWSSNFAAGEITPGTYTAPITATITDDAGNTRTVTDSVQVDTEVTNYTANTASIAGDDVINAAEANAGVTITGTTEPGSTVLVQVGSVTKSATVDANGNWTVTYNAGDIPAGEYDAAITATATDAAGNVSTLTDNVRVDTGVNALTMGTTTEGDDVVNAAERADGVTLNGVTEPGSTVVVNVQGVDRTATVDGNGNWTVTFAATDIPEGTYTATATVTATDAAGNSRSISDTFAVDTAIDTPDVEAVTFFGATVGGIVVDSSSDAFSVSQLNANGTVENPTFTQSSLGNLGTQFTFNSPVPDGTHLVISSEDAAGNRSGTLLVLEDNATNANTLNNAGLSNFDIGAINLDYADQANLVLTENQIMEMSGSSDTLMVHGGNDDTLTVAGATRTLEVRQIDGQSYDVYTIGSDGATLVVEQDINVII